MSLVSWNDGNAAGSFLVVIFSDGIDTLTLLSQPWVPDTGYGSSSTNIYRWTLLKSAFSPPIIFKGTSINYPLYSSWRPSH